MQQVIMKCSAMLACFIWQLPVCKVQLLYIESQQNLPSFLTLDMTEALAAFQLRSLGTLPPGASKYITAPITITTAARGEPNDFNYVKLP